MRTLGFTGLWCEIQRQHLAGLRGDQCVEQFRHQQVRDHGGEPGARTEHHPVGVEDRLDGFRDGRRVGRDDVHGLHLARGERDGGLAPHGDDRVGQLGVVALDQRLELQRHGGHGQHPALCAEQLADQVEGLDVVAELLPEGDDQQVADRVSVEVALGLEPVLDDPGPGAAPVVVAAERGERLAQVAGGRTPSSSRSRPLEPPSSATVTTAVRSPVIRRSAVRDAERPMPPPRATTLGCPPRLRPESAEVARLSRRIRRLRPVTRAPCPGGRGRSRCLRRRGGRRASPTWRPSGACRPCSPRRWSRSACPRGGSRRRSAGAAPCTG